MRRQLRPVLALVLLGTGLLANLPLVGVSLVLREWQVAWGVSESWAATAIVVAALFDFVLTAWGRPRPPAVRSQVPQWWGHSYGPWWASARYGLRLGLGPATILNSWFWWAGVLALCPSPRALSVGLATFVVLRTLSMFAVSWGVKSGSAMAARARVLDALAKPIRFAVLASLLLVVAFSLV